MGNGTANMSVTVSNERVVLITGAAGGLGTALVQEFAAQGWRVVAAGHSTLPTASDERIVSVQLDVTDSAAVERIVKQTTEQWGRIDALINNAGVTADGLSWKISDEDWERVLDVNLKGAFLCSQAVIRPMMKQRSGHIINIGSFAARNGTPGQANYAAAKAGLIGLTESLAREVGSRNVRVNLVMPGVMATPMTAQLTPEQLQSLVSANALGRLNDLAEVARFIAFLVGMENVSGQCFNLDSRIARWT